MRTISSGGDVQQGVLPGVPDQQAAQRAGCAGGADWEVPNFLSCVKLQSCMSICLFVRYPGDSYAGGNPWQLLTAAHAELFYLGAEAALKRGPHIRLVKFGNRKMKPCGHCWGFGKKYIFTSQKAG